MSDQRKLVLELFHAGVNAVVGDVAVHRALTSAPLKSEAAVHLLALGKAANAMIKGAVEALPSRPVRGLMITKYNHSTSEVTSLPWLNVIESSHPVPDERSLAAGAAVVEFVKGVPHDGQLVVLMSGGASSLAEHLIDGLTLEDLQDVNESLLAGGLPIDEMNRVRKTVSAIKGGKLARYLTEVPVTQLAISDVPGDKLSDIGSGLLAKPEASFRLHPGEQLNSLPIPLSDSVVACVNAFGVEAPPVNDAVWNSIQSHIVGSCSIAQTAVVNECQSVKALNVVQTHGSLHGDVSVIADKISQTLLSSSSKGVWVWGGETHLVLPETPGRGGRNQHLALEVAKRIAGQPNVCVLCCGTDGSDGPTSDAGGLVTGGTIAQAAKQNLVADDYLLRADSGTLLEAVDALVTTGPTGTNVMDLVIAVRH